MKPRYLERTFQEVLVNRHLLRPGSRGVVAFSGGPDSVVLLDLLARLPRRWDLELAIAHFDHRLRPGDGDRQFAQEVGERYGLSVRLGGGDVRGMARRERRSIQEAARILRYGFLEELAGELGAEWIAVAHHADDQIETVLLNLSRGTRFRGLAGMPIRRGRIIRPLLPIARASLLAYAHQRRLTYRFDPSNLDLAYRRNWIRHRYLPHLRLVDPGIEARLLRLAGLARRLGSAMDRALEGLESQCLHWENPGRVVIDLAPWRSYPEWLQEEVLRHTVKSLLGQGPSAAHTEALVRLARQGASGRVLTCVPGVTALREYDRLRLERSGPPAIPPRSISLDVPASATCQLVPWGEGCLGVELSVLSAGQAKGRLGEKGAEFFDLDRLAGRLTLRTWRPGDRLAPWGMEGTKKVQDLFTDQKVPRSQRAVWPLLSTQDQLLWVVGIRRGRRAPLTGASTRALRVSIHPVDLEFALW